MKNLISNFISINKALLKLPQHYQKKKKKKLKNLKKTIRWNARH